MRRLLFILTLLLAASQGYAAPASTESVERLLEMTMPQSMIDSVYGNLDQMIRQFMAKASSARSLTPEQAQVMEQMPAKLAAIVREEINWAKMKPHWVRIYQETFEQAEVDGLIAFYGTPSGQALLNKPLITQKSMELAQEQIYASLPRIRSAVEEAMKNASVGR